MTNEQMKANRFARWANARAKIAFILSNLNSGHKVAVCTQTRAVVYSAKHVEMFKATKSGAYVQRGKGWDCIDFCGIKVI
jgi:hypothetical protein